MYPFWNSSKTISPVFVIALQAAAVCIIRRSRDDYSYRCKKTKKKLINSCRTRNGERNRNGTKIQRRRRRADTSRSINRLVVRPSVRNGPPSPPPPPSRRRVCVFRGPPPSPFQPSSLADLPFSTATPTPLLRRASRRAAGQRFGCARARVRLVCKQPAAVGCTWLSKHSTFRAGRV